MIRKLTFVFASNVIDNLHFHPRFVFDGTNMMRDHAERQSKAHKKGDEMYKENIWTHLGGKKFLKNAARVVRN